MDICNETDKTAQRVQRKARAKQAVQTFKTLSDHRSLEGSTVQSTVQFDNATLPYFLSNFTCDQVWSLFSLPFDVEVVALAYFTSTYAPSTLFNYVAGFWPRLSTATVSGVAHAMCATALNCMAKELCDPGLMKKACENYSQALTQTNAALSDPKLALADSTFLSILLLSAFEAAVFCSRGTPRNWTAHVQGCAMLLSLRGKEQLRTELGRKLFRHGSAVIRSSSVQRSVPLPVEFTRLQNQVACELPDTSPIAGLGLLIDRFAAFRASLRGMAATKVVSEALHLDRECVTLLQSLQAAHPYETISAAAAYAKTVRTFRGTMHLYDSHDTARWWNIIRIVRLTLNEWISCAFIETSRGIVLDKPRQGDLLAAQWHLLRARANSNGVDIIEDILASVPYSLDFTESTTKTPNTPARFLIWPLAIVGSSDISPLEAKVFAIDRLMTITKTHGLEQARKAADMLIAGDSIEDW